MPDDNEVLFEITRKHLNTGLRGFPVGTCRTSAVDPMKGLSYVGYPVSDIAFHEPEAAVYLLLNRELPNDDQLASFKADLRSRAGIDPKVLEVLKGLPREGHPMEWLTTGLTLLGMTAKTGDYAEDARNVIAWAPELVAAIFRIRSGWGDPIAPKPEPPGTLAQPRRERRPVSSSTTTSISSSGSSRLGSGMPISSHQEREPSSQRARISLSIQSR